LYNTQQDYHIQGSMWGFVEQFIYYSTLGKVFSYGESWDLSIQFQ
jgi:hypothetical protein